MQGTNLVAGEHVMSGTLAAFPRPWVGGLHTCGSGTPPGPASFPQSALVLPYIPENPADRGGDYRKRQLGQQQILDAEANGSARRLPRPPPPLATGQPVIGHAVENR